MRCLGLLGVGRTTSLLLHSILLLVVVRPTVASGHPVSDLHQQQQPLRHQSACVVCDREVGDKWSLTSTCPLQLQLQHPPGASKRYSEAHSLQVAVIAGS